METCKIGLLLSHATTLNLHTGNLVNRSRLKRKCPSSPTEEVGAPEALILLNRAGCLAVRLQRALLNSWPWQHLVVSPR